VLSSWLGLEMNQLTALHSFKASENGTVAAASKKSSLSAFNDSCISSTVDADICLTLTDSLSVSVLRSSINAEDGTDDSSMPTNASESGDVDQGFHSPSLQHGAKNAVCFNGAVHRYQATSTSDTSEGQCLRGRCYLKGDGADKDPREAVRLFHLAAEQSHREAFVLLRACYLSGTGITANLSEAVRYYAQGADLGCHHSQYHLGRCRELAVGCRKDTVAAVKLYELAAAGGLTEAKLRLARCLKYGDGTKRDLSRAAHLYDLANASNASWYQNKYFHCPCVILIYLEFIFRPASACIRFILDVLLRGFDLDVFQTGLPLFIWKQLAFRKTSEPRAFSVVWVLHYFRGLSTSLLWFKLWLIDVQCLGATQASRYFHPFYSFVGTNR
jgi:hypothetical protein